MATIKVLAGDLDHGDWTFTGLFGQALMTKPSTKANIWKGETIDLKLNAENIEQLDEEKVKKLAGTAGWGLAGAVLLGPLGGYRWYALRR